MEKFLLISEEGYNTLIEKLDTLIKAVGNLNPSDKDKTINSEELRAILHISAKTEQRLRNSGKITFSKNGRKIYYRMADVHSYISKHSFKAFRA